MKNVLLLLTVFNLLSCSAQVTRVPQTKTGYVWNTRALENNRVAVKNKDSRVMPAYKLLLKDADVALQGKPVSVMEKTNMPPSGDKHDYMSLAPYHWPDPNKPDGLPYIRKDGQTNPEVKEYKDKNYMPALCNDIETLALAFYFSGEEVYAKHALKLMRVWFLEPATKMNPNLNFGQAIKGVTEGRGAGLIDSRHFVKLIDAIGLLKGSRSYTDADQKGMQKWFGDFLNWMQTSKVGLDELDAKNNHGAWYDAQRLAMALFIDSTDLAKKIVASAAARLDYQIDDKGLFPAEMLRTISLHYSTFVMDAFFNIAQMADKTGFDLWNYVTPSGKSLKRSFGVIKPYLANQKNWEGQQIKAFPYEEGYTLLKEGAIHYNCGDCEQAIKSLAGEKASRLRLNLLY
jgi:hypothetical protein